MRKIASLHCSPRNTREGTRKGPHFTLLLNNLTLNTCDHLYYAVNRTQFIIRKAIVFIAVSCFEHIFIIMYAYIPLYTILYILFTYFYKYIFFLVSNILSIFTTIETSLLVFSIYSFLKLLVATKFNVAIFLATLFFRHVRHRTCTLLVPLIFH